jgi:crotonobetainyl-CoA:carnitine CoA-transferase CaiB-like acyl-CoA transferase
VTPCSVVRDFGEVVDDPQSDAREMFPTLEHPTVAPRTARKAIHFVIGGLLGIR